MVVFGDIGLLLGIILNLRQVFLREFFGKRKICFGKEKYLVRNLI